MFAVSKDEFLIYDKEQFDILKQNGASQIKKAMFSSIKAQIQSRARMFGRFFMTEREEGDLWRSQAIALGYDPTIPTSLFQNIKDGERFYVKLRQTRVANEIFHTWMVPEWMETWESSTDQYLWFGCNFEFNVPYEEDVFVNLLLSASTQTREDIIKEVENLSKSEINRYEIGTDTARLFFDRAAQCYLWTANSKELPASLSTIYIPFGEYMSRVKEELPRRAYTGMEPNDIAQRKKLSMLPVLCASALWNIPVDFFTRIDYLSKDLLQCARFTDASSEPSVGRNSMPKYKLDAQQIELLYEPLSCYCQLADLTKRAIIQKLLVSV